MSGETRLDISACIRGRRHRARRYRLFVPKVLVVKLLAALPTFGPVRLRVHQVMPATIRFSDNDLGAFFVRLIPQLPATSLQTSPTLFSWCTAVSPGRCSAALSLGAGPVSIFPILKQPSFTLLKLVVERLRGDQVIMISLRCGQNDLCSFVCVIRIVP